MKIRTTSALLLATASMAHADEGFEAKIVGGSVITDKSSAVYQHSVRLLNTGTFATTPPVPEALRGRGTGWRCSGALIHPRVVMTAAHCLPKAARTTDAANRPIWAPFAKLVSESFFRLSPREDTPFGVKAERFVRHPGFDDQWLDKTPNAWNPTDPINDIALILLSKPMPSDKRVAPLIPEGSSPAAGENLLLSGYGRTLNAEPTEPPQLRQVSVPFKELLKNGKEWYVGSGNVTSPDRVTTPQGACSGDSGGPAYRVISGVHYLSGIIVRGPGDEGGGCGSSVSILTDVRAYLPWIRSVLAELVVAETQK